MAEAFVRIRALIGACKALRPLRRGRQYRRATSFDGSHHGCQDAGELLAWSRILNDVEVIVVVNPHGKEGRGVRVELDPHLRPAGSTVRVVCDTGRIGAAGADALGGGQTLTVQSMGASGRVFVGCRRAFARRGHDPDVREPAGCAVHGPPPPFFPL